MGIQGRNNGSEWCFSMLIVDTRLFLGMVNASKIPFVFLKCGIVCARISGIKMGP